MPPPRRRHHRPTVRRGRTSLCSTASFSPRIHRAWLVRIRREENAQSVDRRIQSSKFIRHLTDVRCSDRTRTSHRCPRPILISQRFNGVARSSLARSLAFSNERQRTPSLSSKNTPLTTLSIAEKPFCSANSSSRDRFPPSLMSTTKEKRVDFKATLLPVRQCIVFVALAMFFSMIALSSWKTSSSRRIPREEQMFYLAVVVVVSQGDEDYRKNP